MPNPSSSSSGSVEATRGIFMLAMEWVQECQSNDPQRGPWTIQKKKLFRMCVKLWKIAERRTELRSGIWVCWEKLQTSRAVRVNGHYYSDLDNIPQEFGFVLFGGPKVKSELNQKERAY